MIDITTIVDELFFRHLISNTMLNNSAKNYPMCKQFPEFLQKFRKNTKIQRVANWNQPESWKIAIIPNNKCVVCLK